MFWRFCKHIYTCTDNLFLYGKINREYKKKRQELSRDMSSYKKQWEPCRVNSKQQISMETRFVFTIQINIVESMGLSNYFVSSCSDRIILPIPIFFYCIDVSKFFPPLNSRLKKLRKTCTIYVNHHGGKITSVFKTVRLFVQGQGQRAPDDEWWCASFNLRRLFQV